MRGGSSSRSRSLEMLLTSMQKQQKQQKQKVEWIDTWLVSAQSRLSQRCTGLLVLLSTTVCNLAAARREAYLALRGSP